MDALQSETVIALQTAAVAFHADDSIAHLGRENSDALPDAAAANLPDGVDVVTPIAAGVDMIASLAAALVLSVGVDSVALAAAVTVPVDVDIDALIAAVAVPVDADIDEHD